MDTIYILKKLEERIEERYPSPKKYPKRRSAYAFFAQESYSRWAAKEFLLYLKKESPRIMMAGDKFIRVMDKKSCEGPNSWMYSVAHDVATDLMDYIYTL